MSNYENEQAKHTLAAEAMTEDRVEALMPVATALADNRIEKMREALERKRAEGAPAPTSNPFTRFTRRDTRKSAINAFCWQCMGGQPESSEGATALIRNCGAGPDTDNPCPLWNWRPYQ